MTDKVPSESTARSLNQGDQRRRFLLNQLVVKMNQEFASDLAGRR